MSVKENNGAAVPIKVRRALISVYDKTGIVEFCRGLAGMQIELISTGSTARQLRKGGLQVQEVSEYTGFPEILGNRVKTLHPRVHGGLLARRGVDDAEMQKHGIERIDLVAVNFYPFEQVVEKPDCTLRDAVEHIDIGGPCMVRAAAKNHQAVAALVEPGDYAMVLEQLRRSGGCLDAKLCFRLAQKAFALTARYDGAVSNFLGGMEADGESQSFPRFYTMQFSRRRELRYGENPHQKAALYGPSAPVPGSIADASLLQGKPLSYNNMMDLDIAWQCASSFTGPACTIVKHHNPCGIAIGTDLRVAYRHAYATDPRSAFGGVIALNRRLEAELAAHVLEQQFVEAIVAPSVSEPAREALAAKASVRVLALGEPGADAPQLDLRRIRGGLLLQDEDSGVMGESRVVTRRRPDDEEMPALSFAWRAARYVKSNAIVLARGGCTLGIGAGQMSRIDSVLIALMKAEEAGLELKDAVMASDAFFPFPDSIERAAEKGIRAVIQPGGSVADEQVISAADRHGMAMVFTGVRHFRH